MKLFCLFIDYKKAFDTVWREGLWYKLSKSGIKGKVFNLIKNMYDDIKSCVSYQQEKSDFFVSHKGVRQGENLSPLLFALYVNDLEEYLLNNNCACLKFDDDWLDVYLKVLVLMYADDTVILAESEQGIKNALKTLDNYCREWKLEVNSSKTKVVVFGRGRTHVEGYDFRFNGETVETVIEYKYLGVLFNYNGKFRKSQLECVQSASRAMYCLIGKSRKFDLPIDLQIELFHVMVLPIMLYGCEVWGYSVIREVEILYMKYLKYILGVHKNTCKDIVYGELGVYPVDIVIKTRMLSYWTRLITGKQSKLAYIMYQSLLYLNCVGLYTSDWLREVQSILNNCGMSVFWLYQEVPNLVWIKKAVEQNMKDPMDHYMEC